MRCAIVAAVVFAFGLAVETASSADCVPSGPTAAAISPPAPVGPRGAVGPDVPLSESESVALGRRVTVEGRTSAAIQAACDRASQEGVPVVFLPAGEYTFDKLVRVPGGVTVLGEGSSTLCQEKLKPNADGYELFLVHGDRVRFSRLRIRGSDPPLSLDFENIAVLVDGGTNIRVDHCEMMLMARGVDFRNEASGQVDHCMIHNNVRPGLGYGVAIESGAYVLVTDNETGQCRHVLASTGYPLSDVRGGRKTHWEFLHNHVDGDTLIGIPQAAVDTHSGYDGTFVVASNHVEHYQSGIGIYAGSGLILGNLFESMGAAILLRSVQNNHVTGWPHDVQIAENTFLDGTRYILKAGDNITVNGSVVPGTSNPGRPPALPIPRLQEMRDDGILHWDEAWPSELESGSVTGTVTDEAGTPLSGATVLIGERSATTDAQGQFHLDGVSEAARFCVVMKAGFKRTVVGLSVGRYQISTIRACLRADGAP